MSEVFCNRCGHRNPPASNFCSSCGAPLDVRGEEHTVTFQPVDPGEGPDEELTVALDAVQSGSGTLIVKRGPNIGQQFRLTADVTRAGRHPDSDIFLDDITVSRRHVELARTDAGYVVRDVGSLNGTYLNRERIDEAPLANGDEIRVGSVVLRFRMTSPKGLTSTMTEGGAKYE